MMYWIRKLLGTRAIIVRYPQTPYVFSVVFFATRWSRGSYSFFDVEPDPEYEGIRAHPTEAIDYLREEYEAAGYRTDVLLAGAEIDIVEVENYND